MTSDKLKVLVVNRMMGRVLGGGEVFDTQVASWMQQAGHCVHILTSTGQVAEEWKQAEKPVALFTVRALRLHRLENALRRRNPRAAALLRYLGVYLFERAVISWLARHQRYTGYDVVCGCSMVWLPEWLLSRFSLPVVNWLPGIPSNLQKKILLRLQPRSHFACFTHGEPAQYLQEHLGWQPGKHFHIINPGIDQSMVEAARHSRDTIRSSLQASRAVVGVTVARLVEVKNHRLLLQGIARCVRGGTTNLKWLMIGAGPEDFLLQQLTEQLAIDQLVIWCGSVQHDHVHRYYAASDLFALTSRYENFSIAALEAMAHGLPLVATRVGFLQQLVEQSGAGVLVSPNDAEAVAHAIHTLASDRALREEMGERGRQFARQMTWQNTAQQVANLCYAVVGERHA
ncbi:MAG: glycosyltransferase family 4 protein [Armatimonadota bacterium]|nr:glycosyltransferase family 4 protein [Armatimonadota bacterium]MDW8289320.1 glycosyltransferase family 4 protein [Armatimonadota bacterium]